MRLTVLISLATLCLASFTVRTDDTLTQVTINSCKGYIVPENYAKAHCSELTTTIPGIVKIDGFWTPSEQDVEVADRVLRDSINDAVKDPKVLFPDLAKSTDSDASNLLEQERKELALISKNYDRYSRQYVGIMIDGQNLVFCNYSDGTKIDPSTDYIFVDKVFVPGGTIHFLQCRFEPKEKKCSNVSIIGSWQPKNERKKNDAG